MPKNDDKIEKLMKEKTTIRVSQYTVNEINEFREIAKEWGLNLTHDDVIRALLNLHNNILFLKLDAEERLEIIKYRIASKGCLDEKIEFTINALLKEIHELTDFIELLESAREDRLTGRPRRRGATKTTTVSEKNKRDKSPDGEIDGSEGGSR